MDFVTKEQLASNSDFVAVNMPTFMVKPFLIKSLKKDNESKEVIALMKGIKKVKVLTLSTSNEIIQKQFENYKLEHHIDELMVVNSEGNIVSINGRQDAEKIDRLLLAVKSSENETVYIDVKGNFKMNDLAGLLQK